MSGEGLCCTCEHWRTLGNPVEAASGKCRKVLDRVAIGGGIARPGNLVTEAGFGCNLHAYRPGWPPVEGRFVGREDDVTFARVEPRKLARATDVEASKEAARSGDKHGALMTCLRIHATYPSGLIDDELAALAGHPEGHETFRRRGADLRALGYTEWVRDEDGRSVRRKTSIGGSAGVARITPLGEAVARGAR